MIASKGFAPARSEQPGNPQCMQCSSSSTVCGPVHPHTQPASGPTVDPARRTRFAKAAEAAENPAQSETARALRGGFVARAWADFMADTGLPLTPMCTVGPNI